MTGRAPRPATVTYGALCMGVSLLIGVSILLFAWREPRAALISLAVVGPLIVAALFFGWPRWVIAAVAVTSVVSTLPQVGFQLSYGVVVPVATVVQFTIELTALALLFHRRSHHWYHAPRSTG